MRRDWDVVREVLFLLEAGDFGRYADDKAVAHFWMMRDAGLTLADEQGVGLTEPGRDALDTIRDPRVWTVCRRAIAANAGSLPSDLLLSIARGLIREFADALDACEPVEADLGRGGRRTEPASRRKAEQQAEAQVQAARAGVIGDAR